MTLSRRLQVLMTSFALVASVGVVSACTSGTTGTDTSCTIPLNTNSYGTAKVNATAVQAIVSDTAGNNKLTAGMLFGGQVESGLNPKNIGITGGFGLFQIQEPGVVHTDITQPQALNAAYATNYMLPRYKNAVKNVPPQLWQSNPMAAVEDVAINAEVPAYPYHDWEENRRSKTLVPDTYALVLKIMGKLGISTNFGAATLVDNTNKPVSGTAVAPLAAGACGNNTVSTFLNATGARKIVVDAALAERGKPYAWAGGNANGATPGVCTRDAGYNDCNITGFDCSGLVLYAFAKVHISFGAHLAATQYKVTKKHTVTTNVNDLTAAQPGDLVFFRGSYGSASDPGHVGIYLGDGKMINAPESGETVSIIDITRSPRRDDFVAITNPFAR